MKRAMAWALCLIAVLLPHRARIIYAELIGWAAQALYGAYVLTLKVILRGLGKEVPR
jgi:hypothetical protein